MSPQHHIGWFELYVNDFEKSKDFYTNLFGWEFNLSQSSSAPYWNIKTGENSIGGGLMKKSRSRTFGAVGCSLRGNRRYRSHT